MATPVSSVRDVAQIAKISNRMHRLYLSLYLSLYL